ncbi:hypothetical protein IFM89_002869 [Coptis chinensis]|uniref:Uncharacterized protein n=1 Tax=Coptis chinensis TaxID=261450 RepID=A0A835H2U1_9MAGN|nr:hypothetical protein IFM89_002869 [Coptis chinensis]
MITRRRPDVFNKRETLYDIKMELLHGFRDWQDEAFYMLTGETKDTIAEGRVVQVTILKCYLEKSNRELESRKVSKRKLAKKKHFKSRMIDSFMFDDDDDEGDFEDDKDAELLEKLSAIDKNLEDKLTLLDHTFGRKGRAIEEEIKDLADERNALTEAKTRPLYRKCVWGGSWSTVAKSAGLNRNRKSCRLRWVNYLRLGLKRGQLTPDRRRKHYRRAACHVGKQMVYDWKMLAWED